MWKSVQRILSIGFVRDLARSLEVRSVKHLKIEPREVIKLAAFRSIRHSSQQQFRVNILVVVVILYVIIASLLILYGIGGITFGIFDDVPNRVVTLIALPGIVLLTGLRTLHYVHGGKTQIASRITVVIGFVAVFLAAYYSGGLYSSAMLGLLVILVVATVLLDLKSMTMLYVITLICFFLLLLAEVTGALPIVAPKDLPLRMLALIVAATFLFVLVSYHRYAIRQSEQIIAELKIKNERYETERELTQNLAHDLRTPITTLKTTAYLIQKRHEKGLPVDDHILKLDNHLNHMNAIIANLLEMTFLDTISANSNDNTVNIRTIIKECLNSMDAYARQHRIALTLFDEAGGEIYVKGSETQLKRLFDKIIENGIHYGCAEGYVKISLQNTTSWIEVLIEDNGIGIAPEHHERVFERFFRIDQARSVREGTGTGIGLSIAKRIIELHGGSITLKSELGKGSAFKIVLPTVSDHSLLVPNGFSA